MRAALIAMLLAGMVAGNASAQEKWTPTIRFNGPSYFATAYGDDSGYIDNTQSPNARARVSFTADATKWWWSLGPVLFRPEIGFTWYARRWPIGADSSPIGANNEYRPEAYLAVVPGSDFGLWGVVLDQATVGWAHASNGQDAASQSASMDRFVVTSTLKRGWLEVDLVGWYLLDTGSETAGIVDYINFASWTDAGGEIRAVARFDFAQAAMTLGLTSQDFEALIPMQDEWAIGVYVWCHNGAADGILDYSNDHTSGGAGIAVGGL